MATKKTTCRKEDIIENVHTDEKKEKVYQLDLNMEQPEYDDVSNIKDETPDYEEEETTASFSFILYGTNGTDRVDKDEEYRHRIPSYVINEVIDDEDSEEDEDYENTEQHKLEESWNEEIEKNFSIQSDDSNENCYNHFLYDAMMKKRNVYEAERHGVSDPEPCNMCDETYSCQCRLKQSEQSNSDEDQDLHNKASQSGKKKKYLCEVCNAVFPTLRNLKQHQYIHSEDKSLRCDICKKGFSYAKQLSRHKLTHNTDKKYECDICKKVFNVLEYLKRHKLIIHNDDKLYQCDICSKILPHSDSLRKHRLIHKNVKPYQCNICTKYFSTAGILKRHKLIHSDLKMYRCSICSKGFNDPQSLRRHTLTHKNN